MSDVIDFKPPVKGIDESLPARAQADLTCPDALNVRGLPSLSNDLTVGKRDGYGRAFNNAAGGGGGQPGTGLATALRASSTAPTTIGTYVPVVERWSGYAIDTPYSGFLIGTDLRGKYVRVSRSPTDYGADFWRGSTVPPSESIVLVRSGSSFAVNHASFLSPFTGTPKYDIGLWSVYNTSNDVTITLNCFPRARSVDFVECHNIGPTVRGTPDASYYVWAYLERQSENTVRIKIESVEANVQTTIAVGDNLTLPGSNSLSNNCSIRLVATATGLEARLLWPDVFGTTEYKVSAASSRGAFTAFVEYNTFAGTPFVAGEVITQAGSGATGIVMEDVDSGTTGILRLWVTSGTFATSGGLTGGTGGGTASTTNARQIENARGGVMFRNPATSFPGSEPGYFRRVSGLDFSELQPPSPEVVAELLGTQTATGISRYYIPPGWVTVDIDSTALGQQIYRAVGGQTGLSSATAFRSPQIDDVENVVLGTNTARGTKTAFATIEAWRATPPDEHLAVEFRLRDIGAGEEDTGGAVFCIEDLW